MTPQRNNILVVDDEPVIVESARKILSAEGYVVRTANTAESALSMLRDEAPDIALVDLKLPELSGMDLLGIVKKEFPHMGVIVMTGYTTEENALAAMQNGAVAFLPKPFSFEELLSAIQRASQLANVPLEQRNT